MRFRPCIDIHNGKVKQIVGGSLRDGADTAKENFVSNRPADFYAGRYKEDGLFGGHVILLNSADSPYYNETKKQAIQALKSYKGGLQAGGGINAENAKSYLEAGASHVIVTSFVFSSGRVNYDNLIKLSDMIGRSRLVLDLSCKKRDGRYYIMTDRWQRYTDEIISEEVLYRLSDCCDEFLIHGVDAEGKTKGIDEELLGLMTALSGFTMTYAGGISSMEDIEKINSIGKGKIDFTVGSALDMFGGELPYDKVKKYK